MLHLHGEVSKVRSVGTENVYEHGDKPLHYGDLCPDGFQLRPHIVWFGESVPNLGIADDIVRTADIFIVAAKRSAIGSFGGSLKDTPPIELAIPVAKAAIDQSGISAQNIDHAIYGHVIQTEPRDMYSPRCISIGAGLPETAPAFLVNRLCGSGLQAIVSGIQLVKLGDANTVLAGGVEVMSQVPIGAAIGGMVFPALIFVLFNAKHTSLSGWAIPCATDIAFALGILSLLSKRIPKSLIVFLSAIAIADDLGAVIIIALFFIVLSIFKFIRFLVSLLSGICIEK